MKTPLLCSLALAALLCGCATYRVPPKDQSTQVIYGGFVAARMNATAEALRGIDADPSGTVKTLQEADLSLLPEDFAAEYLHFCGVLEAAIAYRPSISYIRTITGTFLFADSNAQDAVKDAAKRLRAVAESYGWQ
jgi:hypothetical protein